MGKEIRIVSQLVGIGFGGLPAPITAAGEPASKRFIEFFTANIRNKNTRMAYARAVMPFFTWCKERHLELSQLQPSIVAAYIEQLQETHAAASVKQHLAAIRMLFDYLVLGQVLPMNPASAVRGPKHTVKRGKTPVLTAEEARTLIDSINVCTTGGLRDRALIGVMVYTFARVGAVVGMKIGDYYNISIRSLFLRQLCRASRER